MLAVRALAFRLAACAAFLACLLSQAPARAADAPVADHHQHVFSPAMSALQSLGGRGFPPLTGEDVVQLLDLAGIRQGVLLSTAYLFGSPARNLQDEEAQVRAENDWVAEQAQRSGGRLRAFCGFNPLKDYALRELARCAAHPELRRGLKLHLGNADVQLERPEHSQRLREVFAAANAHRMAIAVHMRASISRQRPYGAAQAQVFLETLLPAAPDVVVQVAHMAGTGPGFDDPPAHEALAVLAEAVARGDPRTRQLWFDVASVTQPGMAPAHAALLARRIRQVRVERVVFGTDAAVGSNLRPREAWAAFRALPLTEDEFARIAGNVAPYLR
jgi:predicted TIM-barrel fold metal-dependent hydrolase